MSDSEHPLRDAIAEAIRDNEVILFMKGVPEAPACGFSARATACLQALDVPFAAVDVLPDPRIRQELSALSNWPTIPQLFVKGELIGGSDIIMEMYESGELAPPRRSGSRTGSGSWRASPRQRLTTTGTRARPLIRRSGSRYAFSPPSARSPGSAKATRTPS